MIITEEEPNNLYDICTWRPKEQCEGCPLRERLKCRFRRGDLLHFMGMFLGFALSAVTGVIRSG